MCDPVTLTVVALAAAGTSAYGAYKQKRAERDTAKYNAAVATNNKVIAQRQADDSRKRGEQEERNYRSKLEKIKAEQRSTFAGAGVVIDSGSPLDMLGETSYLGEIDALTIRNNAEREAYSFEVQAANFQNQSSLLEYKAKNIKPGLAATSTFLTSATQAASIGASGGGGGGGASGGGSGGGGGGGGA